MIFKYEVLNPVIDTKKPFFKNGFLYFYTKVNNYRYYVEVANIDEHTGGKNYYILLSNTKFDKNCRLCKVDNYGRLKIKLRGEIKEYVEKETNVRGNIEVTYFNSDDIYNVYKIE